MQTKELIVETALQLFVKNGVKAVTINKIVTKLHTSKRTFYTHFEDKAALLKDCLKMYNQIVRKENEAILKEAENEIAALGFLHQAIVKRAHQLNVNFYSDLVNYYPKLLNESYTESGKFAHQQFEELAKAGIKNKVFVDDMDIELTGIVVFRLENLLKDKALFPITKFTTERLTFGVIIPYLKGFCTSKGMKLLKKQENLFKVNL